MNNKLKIADKEFTFRLFVGTVKFSSSAQMQEAVLVSESELVTMALKRIDIHKTADDLLTHLKHLRINLLLNTSGVRTSKEGVFATTLAREALGTNWVKLEIHIDPRYLLLDPIETLKATA
jgi:thiazole synthase